jgi:hypothetical protein
MALSADNFVQENTGTTASGTSHVVTLPSGTTAGNTVMVFFNANIQPSLAEFAAVKVSGRLSAQVKSEVTAAESSWTFTTGGSVTTAWYAVELSNIDAVVPLDASASGSGSIGDGGTLSTGTTGLNAGLSTVAFAVFGGAHTVATSWAGYTNGFEEVADVAAGASGGLAAARKFTEGTTGTFESTATLTTSASATTYSMMVVFRAADSPIVAPLAMLAGFEWGTHGGAAAAGSVSMFGGFSAPSGTWGTTYLIQAGSARNSAYGLQIVQSAAAGYVRVGNVTTSSATCGFNTRVVSATGTPVVAALASNAGSIFAQVLYDSSTTKFGVRCGTTGTVSWESGTTPLNTWRWIDLRFKCTTATWHADWRIETGAGTYTDQAGADLTGQSPGLSFHQLQLGYATAQTMTADYDDVVLSTYYVAYPLGPHEVRLLTVDPAGTPTISGTTTNFSTFASNGTLTAWNATTARNAVDEVPVTISAAADGVTQTAAAASDYMEFPMATYTLGPTEFVNGVRMMAAIGSGTGSGAGDIAIRGYDGTTETALATVSQLTPGSPTAITSTVPLWRCAMWQSTNGWTQAELNAAALRAGFSADATPDMWIHALYLEAAIGKTKTVPALGEAGSSEMTVEYDPTRAAMVSATLDTPADQGATMRWTDTGGSGSQAVGAASSYTKQFNAADSAGVSVVEVESDPEFTERE